MENTSANSQSRDDTPLDLSMHKVYSLPADFKSSGNILVSTTKKRKYILDSVDNSPSGTPKKKQSVEHLELPDVNSILSFDTELSDVIEAISSEESLLPPKTSSTSEDGRKEEIDDDNEDCFIVDPTTE